MKLIMEHWKGFLKRESTIEPPHGAPPSPPDGMGPPEPNHLEEEAYDKISGEKFVIDLQNMSIVPTKHGEERRHRHKHGSRGMTISKGSIIKAIESALGSVMNDFMNGELENGEPFLVRATQGKQPTLNVVCALKMKKGPDALNIITVMRKDDFKTDNFGGGAQKEYSVSI